MTEIKHVVFGDLDFIDRVKVFFGRNIKLSVDLTLDYKGNIKYKSAVTEVVSKSKFKHEKSYVKTPDRNNIRQ